LWRPEVLRENFASTQRIRSYFDFPDVDVDRYVVDGERRVLMVSGREVTQDGIPEQGQTWLNRHLVYTHGYGAVAAQVNGVTADGAPLLTLEDIPPEGEPATDEPRIYFGEQDDVPFSVVNSDTPELEYVGAGGEAEYTYQGTGGIPMGGWFRRGLFAWRFRGVNLLISGLIGKDSRILINRDIRTRITKAAPFLKYDKDPYAAIVDGRLVYREAPPPQGELTL